MTLLVDTHVWLWFLLTPHRLADAALDTLSDQRNVMKLSVASEWEIVIKVRFRASVAAGTTIQLPAESVGRARARIGDW